MFTMLVIMIIVITSVFKCHGRNRTGRAARSGLAIELMTFTLKVHVLVCIPCILKSGMLTNADTNNISMYIYTINGMH